MQTSSRSFTWIAGVLTVAVVGIFPVLARTPQTPPTSAPLVAPIDPQVVRDQDDMTWDDYKPIPGHDWDEPGSRRDGEDDPSRDRRPPTFPTFRS